LKVFRVQSLIPVVTVLVAASTVGSLPGYAQSDDADALLDMVVELLASPDRDMRGLALQQVRDENPGEKATKRFVEELPKLPAEAQAGLLEALGERGDVAARPAVVDMVKSENETVRAAATGALAKLGGPDDVPLLAEQMDAGPQTVQAAARQTLIRLQGEKVNEAILATLRKANPESNAALLEVLARRNAQEAIPDVLEASKDESSDVRVAAIRALRLLATEEQAADLVGIVKAAKDATERYQAKLALLVLCGRDRDGCAEAIIAGLDDADSAGTVALLEALARAGGDKALAAVVERLDDGEEEVRNEAVRMLAIWADPAAAEHLQNVAETAESVRHQVVAVRGLALMAQPRPEQPANMDMLIKAMELAKRADEKRMVLGFAGASGNASAAALILPALDNPELAEVASLAAVLVAEQAQEGDKEIVQEALQKAINTTKNNELRKRAQAVLENK